MSIYHHQKKKISILSLHLGYGGIEKSIVTVANMLCNDYDVELAVCYKLYDKPAFSVDNRVKICYLNYDLKPNREEFLDAVHKKNIFKIFKEGLYSLRVLHYRKKNMIQYIRNTDSDIIISTRDIFNFWSSKYTKDNVLKIGWEHNHFHGDYKYAERIVASAKNLDYFVLVSRELKEYYANRLNNCKCVHIPNAVDEIPSSISSLKNKKMICVGRLSLEKGHMDLLKVYSKIYKTYPDWTLDIVGDGTERENLENYIKSHDLENKVILHGFQGKSVINRLLHDSSIYLMTSYTESFGIVLIEALSHGVPCIAYDSAEGASEIIQDGVNGFLIKDRNEDVMIQKIEELIQNVDLRLKMGKEAQNSVRKYSKEVVSRNWISLIEEGDSNE